VEGVPPVGRVGAAAGRARARTGACLVLLAVWACAGAREVKAMSQSRVTAMPETKVTVAAVVALDDPGGAGEATLRLADGSALRVPRQSPLLAFLAEWTRKKKAKPLYVESDAGGEVRLVLPAALRQVQRVDTEPKGDRLGVDIRMSPSRHFLKTTRANFAEQRQLLEHAAANKQPLLLTVQPESLEILDARQPPAGLDLPVI